MCYNYEALIKRSIKRSIREIGEQATMANLTEQERAILGIPEPAEKQSSYPGAEVQVIPVTTKELEYYVRAAGLTPMDAIKTATLNAASLLHIENSLGQIQKGFIADIIAVPGDPLEDITLLQRVDFVMKEGKVIKRP